MFSGFGLKPPASGFQSYFHSSLKTSPSTQFFSDSKKEDLQYILIWWAFILFLYLLAIPLSLHLV